MRRVLRYIIAVLALVVGGGYTTSAQELRLGVDFTTLFDNREYASIGLDSSGTLFSARLTPKVGVQWAKYNELMFAADLVQDFGHKSRFLSDVNVQLYYAYRAPRVKLFAGIFPRSEMRGLDSPLFFDRDYRYYANRIGGVLARYEDPDYGGSYVEFAMDYTGMRTYETREAFMLMSSGFWPIGWFNVGYDLILGHYAKDTNPETIDGVVDNAQIVPYIGFKPSLGEFRVDVRLSYIQALQRDRIANEGWHFPAGGEIYLAISRWGLKLANRLYAGGSQLPFWDKYGDELYHGSPLYRTPKGIYESLSLSYVRSFFADTVHLEAGITAETAGAKWGTRQWLQVSIDLDYGIALKQRSVIE